FNHLADAAAIPAAPFANDQINVRSAAKMNYRDAWMIGVLLHLFERRRLLFIHRLAKLFRARFFVKVRAPLANQRLRTNKVSVLRGESLHRNVELLKLLHDLRRADVVVMNDGGGMQGENSFRAECAIRANGLLVLYVRRICGGEIDSDDFVLRTERPNNFVVDGRDDDVAFGSGVRWRVAKTRTTEPRHQQHRDRHKK